MQTVIYGIVIHPIVWAIRLKILIECSDISLVSDTLPTYFYPVTDSLTLIDLCLSFMSIFFVLRTYPKTLSLHTSFSDYGLLLFKNIYRKCIKIISP